MKTWIPVTDNKVVHFAFQADDDLINNFVDRVVKPDNVTTPPWYVAGNTRFVEVTGVDPAPLIGSKFQNGRWTPPAKPVLTAEERSSFEEMRAENARRKADEDFLFEARSKIESGEVLSDIERDRVSIIQAERGASIASPTETNSTP